MFEEFFYFVIRKAAEAQMIVNISVPAFPVVHGIKYLTLTKMAKYPTFDVRKILDQGYSCSLCYDSIVASLYNTVPKYLNKKNKL